MFYVVMGIPALLIFILGTILGVVPAFLLQCMGFRKASDKVMAVTSSLISNSILNLLGCTFKIEGNPEIFADYRKSGKQFCIISNHQSMLDILTLYGPLKTPAGFIAKKEVKRLPFVNIIAYMMHCVFLDRSSIHAARTVLEKSKKNIVNGNTMLVFPEGTRSKTGELLPFKHGSFRLASELGADVVVITLNGTRAALEDRKKVFGHFNVTVHVGEPIPTANLDRNSLFDLIEGIQSDVKDRYAKIRLEK